MRFGFVTIVLLIGACQETQVPVGPTPGRPRFDGAAALELVRTQVAFGPRVPGTEGHQLQLDWMVARLRELSPEVAVDTFSHVTASGDSLRLFNVTARFRPEATRRILLLAHWDTRPRSDQAAEIERQSIPVPGANDGASGTAVLLELAGLFAGAAPPMGVDLLFVDGEDYGPGVEDMFLGAQRYASRLDDLPTRPVYGLLLDMVGDAEPNFLVEEYSAQAASVVVQKVWRAAERLGYQDYFPNRVGDRIVDDHMPLIDAGLPTANLIDFVYGPGNRYWHTPEDTPDRLSAATLEMVGEVVTELIYSGG
ncbi:MAG: M28 family peptidase [Gemmatimonadota bacterium]|nr:M28 family peptidase [Gemmatimonadota bacterium]